MMGDDRTEPASPKKLKKAREEGQVARSAELVSCAIILSVLAGVSGAAPKVAAQAAAYCADTIAAAGDRGLEASGLLELVRAGMLQAGALAAPVVGIVLLAAVASNVLQVGVMFTGSAFSPKWSRLNPAEGFKRMFKPRSLVELGKNVAKVGVVLWVGWNYLSGRSEELFALSGVERSQIAPVIGGMAHGMAMQMVATLTVLAALDYAYQRWEFERNLRMTKQEVKDEFKESEGNPQIKGKIRQRQREFSRRRMIAAVPAATVIITNPTHFAVALKYDLGQQGAPRIVAKGQDLLAQRIREIGKANGVPVMENPPLARALYKAAEVGDEIPADLFRAVAEVLALVWRLDRRRG